VTGQDLAQALGVGFGLIVAAIFVTAIGLIAWSWFNRHR